MATRDEKAERVVTLDTRAARALVDEFMLHSDFPLGVLAGHLRDALEALDAAESRYAQLSALVDTWQRRFNLELQRALAAESELGETREALERAEGVIDAIDHATYGWSFSTAVTVIDQIRLMARAFLARLPTEEE